MDSRDPFRDLTFDGRPAQYREFRRKVILSVAALEDKSIHLAGPKLLSRLSGEAWRCTEHLSVAQLRSTDGWLKVLECLDKHYRHLPEVELHESIDDFLFHLKKRNHEGTTAFAARFRTALSRLENLIEQERAAAKSKRRKTGEDRRRLGPASPAPSSLEDSNASEDPEEHYHDADQTDENEDEKETKPSEAAAAPQADGQEASEPKSGPGSARDPSERGSARSCLKSKKQVSSGTHKADALKAQQDMQREPWVHWNPPIVARSRSSHNRFLDIYS